MKSSSKNEHQETDKDLNNYVLKLFQGFYKENKGLVIGSVLASVVTYTSKSVILPRILAQTFNNIKDISKATSEVKKLVGVWILTQVAESINHSLRVRIEPQLSKYITVELMKYAFQKYQTEYHSINVATVLEKIHLICHNVQDFIFLIFTVFIPRLIVLVITYINFYSINFDIFKYVIALNIAHFSILLYNINSCVESTKDSIEEKDHLYDKIEDLFNNIETIANTSHGFDYEINNLKNQTSYLQESELKALRFLNIKQYTGYITGLVMVIVLIYIVFQKYKAGEIEAEKVTTGILSLKGLVENMYEISYHTPNLFRKIGILRSNNIYLNELCNIQNDNNRQKDLLFEDSKIKFNNVSFGYPGHNLLENYTQEFPENTIISLFGPSGSGKSSFVKLLFGGLTYQSGKLLIGNKDINVMTLKSIRKQISFVSQNTTTLFNTTIYKNIIYGYQDSDRLRNFVKGLLIRFDLVSLYENISDDKLNIDAILDKNVGKLGSLLSGGQKQVIHLLRSVLNKNAKVIIFDEPTSSLDETSRNKIMSLVEYISTGKTVLIITHDEYIRSQCKYTLHFQYNKNPVLSYNS